MPDVPDASGNPVPHHQGPSTNPSHNLGAATVDHRSTPGKTQSTALPTRSGSGKRVVFDVSAQRVWLVSAHGDVARTFLVSGSKFHNLDNGTYQVTSRSRYATAYNSDETMQYMVRFTTSNKSSTPIGFHSIPEMPDGTLAEPRSGLGSPASDGCIREWISDARALWDFAPDGTTVVVRA
jgi:lipoprotein-anchoring transpeptidase ErfK/SrfK